MSTGGTFYAVTEAQLKRLIAGELSYEQFLCGDGPERPQEVYSKFERYWFDLSQVLDPEYGCGAWPLEGIPEACRYNTPGMVAVWARQPPFRLEEIRERCAEMDIKTPLAELFPAVQGVDAFYRRAAAAGHAVLFRVT